MKTRLTMNAACTALCYSRTGRTLLARPPRTKCFCLPTGEDITGVKIFTIAYGDDADADLMKRISNRTNGLFFAADPETIERIYIAISAEPFSLRENSSPITSAGPPPNGLPVCQGLHPGIL